jgi:electron transfer flavoprotein beta subunit
MKAKKKPVDVKNAAALGIPTDAKAKVAKTIPPPARPPGKIVCEMTPRRRRQNSAGYSEKKQKLFN